MFNVRLLPAFILLLLAGCTAVKVGPDFAPPKPELPAAWHNASAAPVAPAAPADSATSTAPVADEKAAAEAATRALAQWWTAFKDPQLQTLIAAACTDNLDVKQAESRLRQARQQLTMTSAGLWPTLNSSAGYRYSRASGQPQAVNSLQAGFDAAWELDIFGGTARTVEAAKANVAATLEDPRSVRVSLAAEVAVTYITLRSVQQQQRTTADNLTLQEKSAAIARSRHEAGFTGALDVATAEAQVASTKAQLPPLATHEQQLMQSLALLLARPPGALTAELSAAAPIPVAVPEVPAGLPSDLLQRRPDIRAAEARLHAATAQIGAAKANLFPKFSLTGSAGVANSQLQGLVNWDRRNYSIGPSVSWPVWDYNRLRAAVAVQDEVAQQALLAYHKSVLTALNEVEQALVAHVKEWQHRQALADAEAANQRALKLATDLYSAGQADFLNVLSAQASLLHAQQESNQSAASLATNLVALYKALGGGWDPLH